MLLGAVSENTSAAALSALALVAAVLVVNDERVGDLSSLDLGDVLPTGQAAERFTVVVALEIDSLSVVRPQACEPRSPRLRQCMNHVVSEAATLFLHHCPLPDNQVPDLVRIPLVLRSLRWMDLSACTPSASVMRTSACLFALQTPGRLLPRTCTASFQVLPHRPGPFARPSLKSSSALVAGTFDRTSYFRVRDA